MQLKNGFTPLTIIVGVVAFIASALGFNGKFAQNKNQACRFQDIELCRFLDKGPTVGSLLQKGYSVRSTTIDSLGNKNEEQWDVVGDNRAHVVNYQNEEEIFNMIIINDDLYVKDYSDGLWWKKPIDAAEKEGKLNIEKIAKNKQREFREIDGEINYQRLPAEECQNSLCLKYKIITSRSENQENQYLLFDDREYLLRKIKREMADGSINEFTIDYQLPVIDEPSLLKAANTNQNIF
jgi:hypothetical protein